MRKRIRERDVSKFLFSDKEGRYWKARIIESGGNYSDAAKACGFKTLSGLSGILSGHVSISQSKKDELEGYLLGYIEKTLKRRE